MAVECAVKTTLVVQAELKLEWGREKYINYSDVEERGAIAWLRLGGWMAHHLRNESAIRLCPLCNERDSWEHIAANCPETERLRWQLLPERFLMSEHGRLASWDFIWGYESRNGICKYLVKVRKVSGGRKLGSKWVHRLSNFANRHSDTQYQVVSICVVFKNSVYMFCVG